MTAAVSKADKQRGRALLWLALAAIAATALAVAAVLSGRTGVSANAMNEKLFPGLGDAAASAASIKIESPTVYVTLNKDASGAWVVADRSNYPANAEGVRALILSMQQLDLIERRTADPARHAALELTTGQAGNGHAVTVTDASGKVLAAMVAGKVQTRAAGTTPGTLFVRRAGEDQTYLARGGIAIPASVGGLRFPPRSGRRWTRHCSSWTRRASSRSSSPRAGSSPTASAARRPRPRNSRSTKFRTARWRPMRPCCRARPRPSPALPSTMSSRPTP